MRLPVLLKRWIPTLFWMAWIFSASTDLMSAAHTSRFVEPLLRWLFHGISQDAVNGFHLVIRKCGHLTEYAVLGFLMWRACGPQDSQAGKRTDWARLRLALAISALYAATDEFHQTFVPSREGMVSDVMIDVCGAAIGLALTALVAAWMNRPKRQDEDPGGGGGLATKRA